MAPPTSTQKAKPKTVKLTSVEQVGGIFCHICHFKFLNKLNYDVHYEQHKTGTSEIIYTCVVCFKEISNYSSFRGHCYTKHLLKTKFGCEHCQKPFSKLSALQSHIDHMHKFKCTTCKKEFPSKSEMQLHQIVHSEDKPPFNCKICSQEIDSISACEEHVELHSEFKYPCPICNDLKENKINVVEHLKTHFGTILDEDPPTAIEETEMPDDSAVDLLGICCSLCLGFKSTHKNKSEFEIHFSEEHSDKDIVYTCTICDQQYNSYKAFSRHCYSHLMKNRLKCTICSKSFERLSLLVVHTQAYHINNSENDKPFSCDECDQSFGTDSRLKRHMRDQHGIEYLRCREPGCDLKFETMNCLMLHQKSHKSISDNWCRLCGLQFTSLENCKNHLDFHKAKLYSCPVCKKTCGAKYDMMKHIPQHFETVLHVCKVCGKIFNAKYRLVEHTKTHSNVKSLNCSHCGKKFATPQTLKIHLSIHIDFKPFRCSICPKWFNFQPNWAKHMKRMHNADSKSIKELAKKAQRDDEASKITENNNAINENMSNNKLISNSDDLKKYDAAPKSTNIQNNNSVTNKNSISKVEANAIFIQNKNQADVDNSEGFNDSQHNKLLNKDKIIIHEDKLIASNTFIKSPCISTETNINENCKIISSNTILDYKAFANNDPNRNKQTIANFGLEANATASSSQGKTFDENEFITPGNIEEGINSLCSELMSKQNCIFADSNQNDVELDSINPTITDKEIPIFDGDEYMELVNIPPVNVAYEFVSDMSSPALLIKSSISSPRFSDVPVFISSSVNDKFLDISDQILPPVDSMIAPNSEDYLRKTYVVDDISNFQYKHFEENNELFGAFQEELPYRLDAGDAGDRMYKLDSKICYWT